MSSARPKARLVGVELYFEDLERARRFYREALGLDLEEEQAGHYAKFHTGPAFVCLERMGVEPYPSRDKAVIFLEVDDLGAAMDAVGRERIVRHEPAARQPWAVLHDPEGHNVMLLQAPRGGGER